MPAKKYAVDWTKLPCAPAEVSYKVFQKLLANVRNTYDADSNSVNVKYGGFNHAIAGLGFNPIASAEAMVQAYPCHLERRKGAPTIVTGIASKCPNCQGTKSTPRTLNDSQQFAVKLANDIRAALTAKPATPAKPATKRKASKPASKRK